MLLRPNKNGFTGEYNDFLTAAPVTPFFLNLLGDDTSETHTVLHISNADYSLGTDVPYASYNIVCYKTPEVSGKCNFDAKRLWSESM